MGHAFALQNTRSKWFVVWGAGGLASNWLVVFVHSMLEVKTRVDLLQFTCIKIVLNTKGTDIV